MLGYFPAAESFFLGVEDDKYFTGGFISVGNTGRLCSTLFDDVIYRECCTILRGIQACPTWFFNGKEVIWNGNAGDAW